MTNRELLEMWRIQNKADKESLTWDERKRLNDLEARYKKEGQ